MNFNRLSQHHSAITQLDYQLSDRIILWTEIVNGNKQLNRYCVASIIIHSQIQYSAHNSPLYKFANLLDLTVHKFSNLRVDLLTWCSDTNQSSYLVGPPRMFVCAENSSSYNVCSRHIEYGASHVTSHWNRNFFPLTNTPSVQAASTIWITE